MPQKIIAGKDISKTVTSEDILGQEVIDFDGGFIGVVDKVLIDPKSLDFVGISIDKGFLRRGLTLGKQYIAKITSHAVFLKIKVAYDLKGKIVFDNQGHQLGRISSIELQGNKNKVVNVFLKSNPLSTKEINIPVSYIKNMGDNVMLNVSRNKLIKKN